MIDVLFFGRVVEETEGRMGLVFFFLFFFLELCWVGLFCCWEGCGGG